MNQIIKSMVALTFITMSSQAMAWTRLATCGTGDALEGMDVFTDGENVIVQILSYQESTQSVVADEYRTNNGSVNPVVIDINQVMDQLSKGESLSFVITKEDSFTFGGVDSKAAMINLKLNPAAQENENHYARTTQVAFEGQVGHFFCYLPE